MGLNRWTNRLKMRATCHALNSFSYNSYQWNKSNESEQICFVSVATETLRATHCICCFFHLHSSEYSLIYVKWQSGQRISWPEI